MKAPHIFALILFCLFSGKALAEQTITQKTTTVVKHTYRIVRTAGTGAVHYVIGPASFHPSAHVRNWHYLPSLYSTWPRVHSASPAHGYVHKNTQPGQGEYSDYVEILDGGEYAIKIGEGQIGKKPEEQAEPAKARMAEEEIAALKKQAEQARAEIDLLKNQIKEIKESLPPDF